MNIPVKIEKLIDKRQKLAEELNSVDVELCKWMESKGMDLSNMEDFTRSGCMIYCEPGSAAINVRNEIKSFVR